MYLSTFAEIFFGESCPLQFSRRLALDYLDLDDRPVLFAESACFPTLGEFLEILPEAPIILGAMTVLGKTEQQEVLHKSPATLSLALITPRQKIAHS